MLVPMKTEDSGEGVSARSGQPWAQLELDCAWDDVVLPAEQLELLRTVCAELRRRDGAATSGTQRTNGRNSELRVLLDGEPGTGKTLVARVVGSELDREVISVDLARLAVEEETDVERWLQRVLAASEKSGAITVLDNPEAVFVKRPAASRRRRPTVDAARLLARFDAHRGPILFESRLKPRIDAELIRRLNFVVDLPFPDAEARRRIWQLSLPAGARVREEDLGFLATSFKLSGGAIHECCASAGLEADADQVPVDLGHVARGLEREYSNRLLSSSTREAIDELRRRLGTSDRAPNVASDSVPRVAPDRAPRVAPDPVPAPDPPRKVPPSRFAAPAAAAAAAGGATAAEATAASARREFKPPSRTAEAASARAPGPKPRPASAGAASASAPAARRRLALLAVGVAVVAGLLGLLVAVATEGSNSPPAPLNGHATAGPLRVSFPTNWKQQTPPASPALGLTDELALAPPSSTGGTVVIGRETTTDASLLPQQLLASLPSQPKPQVVSLNGAQYYRYLDLTPQGANGPVSVYALPTTAGTVIGACLKSGASARFAGECERVLGTVRPTSGSVLALGPSAAYASGLNAAISKLNLVRATADPQLRSARTPAAQVRAANELAAAHKSAAATVSGLSAGAAESANVTLAASLLSTSDAYASLARAAAGGDTQAYATASAALGRAQGQLKAAFTQLSQLGYATS
jgi:ATPase family associated with various cellular activities (AAA)